MISNGMVEINNFLSFDAHKECGVNERVRFSVLAEILEACSSDEELKEMIVSRMDELVPKHIIIDDIFSSINYMNCLAVGSAISTISITWATAAFVPSASCCRISSASVSPVWSASFVSV